MFRYIILDIEEGDAYETIKEELVGAVVETIERKSVGEPVMGYFSVTKAPNSALNRPTSFFKVVLGEVDES